MSAVPSWAWYLWPLTLATLFVWALAVRHMFRREMRWVRRYSRLVDERVARLDEDLAWWEGRDLALTVAMAATVSRYEHRVEELLAGDTGEHSLRVVS
jgi:hypothetical protein